MKVVSKKNSCIDLVIGEDIHSNEIIMTYETTLVGIFIGRRVNDAGLKRWVSEVWKVFVDSIPEYFLLLPEWIAFGFRIVKDASTIVAGNWRWDSTTLFLKRWNPLFDPRIERYDIVLI